MANTWGTVAEKNPNATTLTDAYTVPALTQFVGIVGVSNRSAVGTSFRVSVALAGAADNDIQYRAYDVAIIGNGVDSVLVAAGPADVIRVYATLATLTFTVFGVLKT